MIWQTYTKMPNDVEVRCISIKDCQAMRGRKDDVDHVGYPTGFDACERHIYDGAVVPNIGEEKDL